MMKRSGFVLVLVLAAVVAVPAQIAHAQDRFAVGVQIPFHHAPELGETLIGYGFRFTYGAYLPFLSFDSELNIFPTRSTGNLGETQGFFGLKAGKRIGHWGAFFKVRPGFSHFGGGANPQRLSQQTHFALDLGGGVEYYFAPHLALRWDLGEVIIPFGNATLSTGPGTLGAPLGTQHNFQTSIGFLVHF